MVFTPLVGRFVARLRPTGLRAQLVETNCLLSSSSVFTNQKVSTGFELREVRGNPWGILTSPTDVSIAHCVSLDFQMSTGIAKNFKKKFENVKELKKQGKSVGEVAVLERAEGSFVYYLITRVQWWDAATPESMCHALLDMRRHCEENAVRRVAVPRLGTGYDKLDWPTVQGILENVFKDSGIAFTAYSSR